MTLSIAMIVKNESTHLPRCFASIQGLWDELVVVDTGSTDDTVALAEAAGAKVHRVPWPGSFAEARNAALARCAMDWVLMLDADEAVDPLDHGVIREAVAARRASAHWVRLRNYFADGNQATLDEPAQANTSPYQEGREFPYFSDGWGLRLFQRLEGLQYRGRVHEVCDPWFQARGLPITRLEVVVHHYGKLDRDREAVKRRTYLDLSLGDAKEQPLNAQRHYNVVLQGLVAEAWEPTLAAAQAYLRLEPKGATVIFYGAAMALQAQGRHGEALTHLERILKDRPHHVLAHTRRAVSLAATGRLDEARQALRTAIGLNPTFITPYGNLAELEGQQGKPDLARSILMEGLAACPGDPVLLQCLVQLGLQHGRVEQAAQDALLAIRACPGGGQGVWHRLVAVVLAKQGQTPQAKAILDQGLVAFPGNEDLARFRATLG